MLFLIGVLTHPLAEAIAQNSPNAPIVSTPAATTDNTATARYVPSGSTEVIDTISNQVNVPTTLPLIDPKGKLVGCDGQSLTSYAGFSMALYNPDASGLDIGDLVRLTPANGATIAPPNIVVPNLNNINPFPLSATGEYNFLLDENRGQTDSGKTYILVINPPDDSPFRERRVRIEMQGISRTPALESVILSYTATSLDGQPISLTGETELTRTLEVRDAAFQSLALFTFGINSVVCEPDQISITKSADRAAAQPGDLIVYRLNVRNQSSVALQSVTAIDTFPTGFELLVDSVSAQIGETAVAVDSVISGNSVRFNATGPLGASETIDIVYAVRITPDAVRGSGINSALATGRRTDNNFLLQDGPSQHRTTLDAGILSDCGTLIGRVFEDKDFDGEQQPGEAGIPNAVIFLDDGNRVVTDADGLFSVQKMLPGQRTGTLDLFSLPGYTLAPNLNFSERNSLSRLVNLSPGGLVKMNFGVTPTFQEEGA
ncbi:MAG: hypothetical protein ACFB16_25850 [Phormidesmis sp.]